MQAMYESIPDPQGLFASCSRINACFTSITSSSRRVCPSLSHLEEIPNCRLTLFLHLVKILHTWRDTSKKMKYVCTANTASRLQSGLHWPGSHWDERQMGCNEQRAARCEQQREKSEISSGCSVVWTSAKNPQAKAGVATREEKRERLCDGHVDDGDGLTELGCGGNGSGDCQKGQVEGQLPAGSQRTRRSTTTEWQCCTDRGSPCHTSCTGLSQTAKPTEIDGEQRFPGKWLCSVGVRPRLFE